MTRKTDDLNDSSSDAISASTQRPAFAKATDVINTDERQDLAVDTIPLSYSQDRVWFLEQLGMARGAYYLSAALRLKGSLDRSILRRSLTEVVRRHESLRTRFTVIEGEGMQVADASTPFQLPVVDLSSLPPHEVEAQLQIRMREEFERPFDLRLGGLFRATLLVLAPDESVLLLAAHHIVIDGQSIAVLTRELSALYTSYAQNAGSPLAEPTLQYSDYVTWHRGAEQRELMKEQLDYWKQTLLDTTGVLELPTDRPRPPVATFLGDEVSLPVSTDLIVALGKLARSEGVTLFMVVMAVFQTFLMRWTGQNDVIVGTPISGRSKREFDALIGFFANTLAFRTNLSGDPTFRALLSRVKSTALGAFSHQDCPFEKIVQELRPSRDLGRQPIVQVWLLLDAFNKQSLELPGLEVSHLETPKTAIQFDLTLTIKEMPGSASIVFGYATDLFDRSTISRMAESFKGLLQEVVADPKRRLSQLPMLSPAQQRSILIEWNDTTRAISNLPLPDQFERQANRTPDGVALRFENQHLSYGELNARANQFAHYLQKLGVRPDVAVGVYLERSADMLIALLGIMKAGGAYLPLGPRRAADRVAEMLQGAMAPILVTHSSLVDELPVHHGFKVLMDEHSNKFGSQPSSPPVSGLLLDHLAYVIYTSGSTGEPKGVAVSHRALTNHMDWMSSAFPLDADDIVLQKTPIGFDASVWELFAPLLSGATVALAEPGSDGDVNYLCRSCIQFNVTTLQLVPSVLRMFVEEPLLRECRSLRNIFSGGEALSVDLWRAIEERTGARVHNLYGPTEACIQTIVHTANRADAERTYVPIGRPIWNVHAYVLDAFLRPVPVGVLGELYLSGPCLGRGYLHRADLTAERFVANPFDSSGERMYRTGDRVHWLAGGMLEYLGRSDDQVKIRGMRIELGDVQAHLARYPAIQSAAVVARDDNEGNAALVAYIVPKKGSRIEMSKLRQFLATNLSQFLIPSTIATLDALPLSANGKTDYHALPQPHFTSTVSREAQTPQEEILASLFAEVLGLDRVGVDDSFFDLGGHSLLAMKLISRIRVVLGIEISIRSLFEARTVAALARHLNQDGAMRSPLRPMKRGDIVPLSFAQQRLWFLHRFEGPSPTYNIPVALTLTGDVGVAALSQALHDVIERHEILRTIFQETEGVATQIVLPSSQSGAIFEQGEATDSNLTSKLTAAAHYCFDLSKEAPIKAWLWNMDSGTHVLLVVVHHIASDGGSWMPLARDLSVAYSARCKNEEPQWRPLAVQYTDYTLWQRQLLGNAVSDSSALAGQVSFWRRTLADIPHQLVLPVSRPRPAQPSYRGDSVTVDLDERLVCNLQNLSRESQSTLFMLLHAGAAILLSKLGAGDDILIGCPIAGRNDSALDDLIGFFANTLVLRLDVSGNPTFLDVIERARVADLAAYSNQDLPFEHLVEILNPVRAASHHPLFQVMLTLHNREDVNLDLPGLTVKQRHVQLDVAKMDLIFSFRHRRASARSSDGLSLTIDFARDLFDRSSVEAIAQRFVHLLAQACEHPRRPLSSIDPLMPSERTKILHDWNATERPTPQTTLATLFEQQVQKTPDAIAVESVNGSLSYSQLNRWANQLAHRLLNLGTTAGTRIGLLQQRSERLIVSLLAVSKAGATYVPLHEGHPPSLLKQLMEQSSISVLLTDRDIELDGELKSVQVLRIDVSEDATNQNEQNPLSKAQPGALAYIMYTSGSTGVPKGVCVSHQNIVELALDRCWDGEDQARVLHHSPSAFDASTYEIWVPLLRGNCVVVAPSEAKDIGALAKVIGQQRVTSLFLTTALFRVIVEECADCLKNVRSVWTGGERALPQAFQKVLNACPTTSLIHVYGPTETTTFATSYSMSKHGERTGQTPIGAPMDNTRVYVLDQWLRPVPAHVEGELYIAGGGLAQGYLNNPAATAERFVSNPFSGHGARMYRTGDLVCWNSDGKLEFRGRADQQIKIRGFRIEPGEIEVAISRNQKVAQSLVVAHVDANGRTEVIGYAEPVAGQHLDSAALRADLSARLPDYMMPAAIIIVEKFPLTSNGKIDRSALPRNESSIGPTNVDHLELPRTETEKMLATVLGEVLGIEQAIGVDENFFDLGGHSIAAIQVAARVRSRYTVEIPLTDLFESPTIRQMAQRVELLRLASWDADAIASGTNVEEGTI